MGKAVNQQFVHIWEEDDTPVSWNGRVVSYRMKTGYNHLQCTLRRDLKGCPEKLKQTTYFSLIRSFMEYGATVWDPYQKYNSDNVERVQRLAEKFGKSRYTRYSSVSDMLDELGWPPLSQRRQAGGSTYSVLQNY